MTKYVLVDTVSQYRLRYVIEVPDDHNDGVFPCSATTWAEDTVTCGEMKEFSQLHLGETIISSRDVSEEEILALCDLDNSYCSMWSDAQKMNTFITPIGYKLD